MKKHLILALIAAGVLITSGVVVGGFFIAKNKILKRHSTNTSKGEQEKVEEQNGPSLPDFSKVFEGDLAICRLFPQGKIEEIAGKKFVNVKQGSYQSTQYTQYYCEYRFEELPYEIEHGNPPVAPKNISITFVRGDISSLKDAYKLSEDVVRQDSSIPIPHQLVYNKDGKFLRLELFLADNLEVIVNTWWSTLTQEEAEKFVKDFSVYLKGFAEEKINETGNKTSSGGESNKEDEGAPLPQDEDIIKRFFEFINNGDADKAALMMKVNNDSELQAWAVQFNGFNHVQVLEIKKASVEEWTDSRHIYKVKIDVIMKPESGDEEIPYFGYENGENVRWLTLEKVGDIWKISEISNSP